jgi:cytoskeletal protein RodZ
MTVVKNKDLEQGQGPGLVFIQAREALSITQAETADVLNLSVSVIKALESNDDSVLPERVYVNGYIRSYAKLLGLAAEPLIQAWGAQFPDEMQSQRADLDEEQARNWSVASANPRESTGLGRWILVAILLSVVFIYFVSNQEGGETAPVVVVEAPIVEPSGPVESDGSVVDTTATETVVTDVVVGLDNAATTIDEPVVIQAKTVDVVISAEPILAPEPALEPEPQPLLETGSETSTATDVQVSVADVPIEERQVTEDADDSIDRINAQANGQSEDQTDDEANDQAKDLAATMFLVGDAVDSVVVDPVVTAEVTVTTDSSAQIDSVAPDAEQEAPAFSLPRLTLEGNDRIVLSFTADCWFEIKNVDGEMLHADLGRSEQVREYFGQGPFSIKLGYAQGAAVEFNGASVALAPHTRNNVAKLVLGQ